MGEPRLKDKAWEPRMEEDLLTTWRAEPDLHRFAPVPGQPAYVIDTPPPYPSGPWHIGAVLSYSMIDMIARAQRMLGRRVQIGLPRRPWELRASALQVFRRGLGRQRRPTGHEFSASHRTSHML